MSGLLYLLLLGQVATAPLPEIVGVSIEASEREDSAELIRVSGLAIGQPMSQLAVRRAVKRLYAMGRFNNVFVYSEERAGGVALRLVLPPRPHLLEIRWAGLRSVDSEELEPVVGIKLEDPVSKADLPDVRRALQMRLAELGHRDAAVGVALQTEDDAGGRAMIVRVDEGPRTSLRRLVIRGEPRQPLADVSERLGLAPRQPVRIAVVNERIEALLADYRRRAYLDVRIEAPVVREVVGSPAETPLADLLLDIYAGPKVDIRFKGNHGVTERALREDIAPLRELGTGRASLLEVQERMESRYRRRGYYKVKVAVAARRTLDGARKEILFSIREGPRASVTRLEFPGNELLDDGVLRERVVQVVRRYLDADLDRPGADPKALANLLGDRSMRKPRESPAADTSPVDPARVYIPRAYRTAADTVADLYRERGFQNVKVGPVRLVEQQDERFVVVEIPVQQGLQWRVGALGLSGHESVEATELFSITGLEPGQNGGEALAFDSVENARRALVAHYKNQGFLFVSVQEELRQLPERGSLESWGYVKSSTTAPLNVRSVCARAEAAGAETCEIELRYQIQEGPRVRAREVITRHNGKTREAIIKGEITVAKGDLLSESALETTRDNLLRLGVFDRVVVRPVEPEEVSQSKDVIVDLYERKSYTLDLGGGASTAEGFRVFAGFGDGNLLGTALRLQLQAKVNIFFNQLLVLYADEVRPKIRSFYEQFSTLERIEYEVALGLTYPRIFGLPTGFSAGLDVIALRDYDPAFAEDAQNLTLVANYKGFRPKLWKRPRPLTLQLRSTFERSSLECNSELQRPELCSTDLVQLPGGGAFRLEGTNVYITIGPQVSFDLRDDPLDPTAGLYAELSQGFAVGFDSGSPDFVQLAGRLTGYLPIVSRLTAATSFSFGKIFPLTQSAEIPVNRRYFAGGRSTIRGYPERSLLPQDTELDPATGQATSTISSGGLLYMALKSELRISVYGPLALALFYDVGDLYASGKPTFSTTQTLADGTTIKRGIAHGGGIGFRVATPVGPLAFDLAVPFDRRDRVLNDVQLHFAVGTF